MTSPKCKSKDCMKGTQYEKDTMGNISNSVFTNNITTVSNSMVLP